jgi:2Fe-2S ferredoxin
VPPADAGDHGGRILVEPAGISFDARAGETVFDAAARHGFKWPTVCGGVGSCRTCIMTILEGADACSPIEAWEAEGLEEVGAAGRQPGGPVRMACQTRLSGPVRVRKPGVRAIAISNG